MVSAGTSKDLARIRTVALQGNAWRSMQFLYLSRTCDVHVTCQGSRLFLMGLPSVLVPISCYHCCCHPDDGNSDDHGQRLADGQLVAVDGHGYRVVVEPDDDGESAGQDDDDDDEDEFETEVEEVSSRWRHCLPYQRDAAAAH